MAPALLDAPAGTARGEGRDPVVVLGYEQRAGRVDDPAVGAGELSRAVEDFEKSLTIAPDPDVQLAIAEAAQFDPATPMRPVTELQSLLDAYPDHVGANLMMGERRLMIGRYELARESFEKVVALTEPGDPVRERAELALASVSSQTSG